MNWKRSLAIPFVLIVAIIMTACSNDGSGKASAKGDENFPNKPIQIVVGFDPGGGSDMGARIIAKELGNNFGDDKNVNVVVENKPGGGGVVAMTEVINKKGDGYTIGFTPVGPITLQPHYGQTTYQYDDPVPISQVASTAFILAVHKDAPWDDFDSFLKDVQDNPGKYSYGNAGAGTAGEISMLQLEQETGIDIKGVPFKGNAPARTSLMAGDVDAVSLSEDELTPYAESGEVKLLLNFSQNDIDGFPDLPKATDLGFDMEHNVGWLFYGPKDMPNEIRDAIDEALKKTMENEEVRESMEQIGFPVMYLDSEELAEFLEERYDANKEVIEKSGKF